MKFTDKRLHIMVTRPERQATPLIKLLQNNACDVLHIPTLKFIELHETPQFKQALQNISQQDWLIFISPQAVYSSSNAIRQKLLSTHSSSYLKYAAIGPGTANALQEAGFNVDALPTSPYSSETLLELPIFQTIKNKKIMLVHGEEGRDLLELALSHRGALVSHLIAYRACLPEIDKTLIFQLMKNKPIDVIIVNSGMGVINLKKLLGDTNWAMIKNTPLIVVSQRVHDIAKELGFETLWVSEDASPEAILKIILQKRKDMKND